jgi:hypothetical protein
MNSKNKSRYGRPKKCFIAEPTKHLTFRLKIRYCDIIEELQHYYQHYLKEPISRAALLELILKNEYQQTLKNNFNILGLDFMICKQCKLNGVKSTIDVIPLNKDHEFNPFYDENGQYHIHDSNLFEAIYRCSKGHQWSSESKKYVCWCGWGKEDVIK